MLNIQVVRSFGKVVSAQVIENYDYSTGFAENRNDWKTFEAANEVAAALGSDYIATDAGPCVSPRYDVIKLPQVGEAVSYAFNGDSYPCGHITKISKSKRRIETSEGKIFFRRKLSGAWINNGTWSLIGGHVEKRNPHF